MDCILRNAEVYRPSGFVKHDVLVRGGRIERLAPQIPPMEGVSEFDMSGCCIVPGLVDVHVHFREPGFSCKETMRTGSLAGAHGGYTTVCTMPNLNPAPDSVEHLERQREIIRRDAVIRVLPYGTITVEEKGRELADMEGMAPFVAGFSDDGRGVQNETMMREAMIEAKRLGKIIYLHLSYDAMCARISNLATRGVLLKDGESLKDMYDERLPLYSKWAQAVINCTNNNVDQTVAAIVRAAK